MIRIGVIGAGGNAKGNAEQLAKDSGRCRIVAVADPVIEAAKKLASIHGAKACADFREFLGDVDAVVVSSPNFLHPEQTIVAAQAGKHVWCEKPMALSIADADRMVDAVEKAKVASMVGFSVRFDPAIRATVETLRAGRLGPIVSIWSRRLCYFDPDSIRGWRLDFAKSGGVMSELIAHEIDWVVDAAGSPKSVFCRIASRRHADPRDNDHIIMALVFEGEATGTIEGSQMSHFPEYYRGILGAGAAAFTADWGRKAMFQEKCKEASELPLPKPFNKHAHFLDVIEGKCECVCDVRWGRKIVAISEKALESAVRGEAMKLSL